MADDTVTVAIPTLDAGPGFAEVLAAVRAQRLTGGQRLELLICDSGSRDQTPAIARAHDAQVLEIGRRDFSHGGTRNLLMERAGGAHVAFLTQDAVPSDGDWLAGLLAGFAIAPDAGLVFGPYRPREDASLSVARELVQWFQSLSPNGDPRIERLEPERRDALAPRDFLGALGFFTDANGCVARAAWERVPFRQVAYAEDHLLAQDMLRAGYAKVYVPGAAVIHSHEYTSSEWLRRSFDEARAVQQIYGEVPGATPREALLRVRGGVAADYRWAQSRSDSRRHVVETVARSGVHHGARVAGTMLGARAARLPSSLSAKLSLESRR